MRDGVVLVIDGDTGALKYRYPLQRSRFIYDSVDAAALANGCTQPPEEFGPGYSAPVIGNDGRAYVTVGEILVHVRRRWLNNACVDALVNFETTIKLLAFSPSGSVTTQELLTQTDDQCSEIPYSKQVLTDGGSGILVTTVTKAQCSADDFFDVAYKTLLIDSAGAVTTFPSTPGHTIAMTSDTGTAYLLPITGGNVVAKDMATWATKFTAPVAGPPLIPLADDGVVVRGNNGLVFLDGNGSIMNTMALSVQDVRPVGPGLYQGTNGTAGAVEVTAPVPIRAGSYFVWAYGNQFLQRQAQTCDPGHPPFETRWKTMLPGTEIVYGFSDAVEWTPARTAAVDAALVMWENANIASKLNTRFRNDQTVAVPDRPLHITVLPQVFDAQLRRQSALFWPLNPIGSTGIVTKARIEIGLQDFSPSENPITDLMFTKITLHEAGHGMGLGHNGGYPSPLLHPYGFNGSSVMNQPGGWSDSAGWMSSVVTPCDAAQARAAALRRWP